MEDTIRERLEEERASALGVLKKEVDRATLAIKEREAWLNASEHTTAPEFKIIYTKRKLSLVASADARQDIAIARLETTLQNSGVSANALSLIALVRSKASTSAQDEINAIEDSYESALRTNPSYSGLSESDMLIYNADRDAVIDKVRAKIIAATESEIKTIISNDIKSRPRVRRNKKKTDQQQDLSDTVKAIKRDASLRYQEYKKQLDIEESTLIADFEVYLSSLVTKTLFGVGPSADDIHRVRLENTDQIKRSINVKIKQFNTVATRQSRMAIAEEIEKSGTVQRDHITSLLHIYTTKINAVKHQKSVTVPWDQAMLDIDSSFDRCNGNWDRFTNILRDYWGYVCDVFKRQEYDRLARLYAVLFKDSVADNTQLDCSLNNLRLQRDKLHKRIFDLDEKIHAYTSVKRHTPRVVKSQRGVKSAKKAMIYDMYVSQSKSKHNDSMPPCLLVTSPCIASSASGEVLTESGYKRRILKLEKD